MVMRTAVPRVTLFLSTPPAIPTEPPAHLWDVPQPLCVVAHASFVPASAQPAHELPALPGLLVPEPRCGAGRVSSPKSPYPRLRHPSAWTAPSGSPRHRCTTPQYSPGRGHHCGTRHVPALHGCCPDQGTAVPIQPPSDLPRRGGRCCGQPQCQRLRRWCCSRARHAGWDALLGSHQGWACSGYALRRRRGGGSRPPQPRLCACGPQAQARW
jgi:hypothetical protein